MWRGSIAEYLRISDDDQDLSIAKHESDSIANQRKVIHYFIEQDEELLKYPMTEFCDDGYSGVNFKRPGVQALLKEVRENKISCIIVKDFSRFGRNYIEVGDYLEQVFPFYGIRFISVSDHYDSKKSTGGIEVGFKTLIHDLYSRDLSKKVKSVKHIHQNRGQHSGGGVPFGYLEIPNNKISYEVDPEAANIIKKIFELAADGKTTGMIAGKLNEKKIPTPGAYRRRKGLTNYVLKNDKSNFWTSNQVKEVIQNETYLGTYICHKIETVHVREIRKTSPGEYRKHENAHEAIISRELFETAQKAITSRGKRGKYHTNEENYVLKGKLKCGFCGYSLNRVTRVKEPYYTCRMGKSCGSGTRIGMKELEDVVLKSIQQVIMVYQEEKEKKGENQKKVLSVLTVLEEKRMISMKLEHYKREKLTYYKEYKEGRILIDGYKIKQKELEGLVIRYSEKLKIAESKIEALAVDKEEESPTSILEPYLKVSKLSRSLVDELIKRIDVYGSDRIEIQWNFREKE